MFQTMISRAIAQGGLTVAKSGGELVEVRFFEGYQVSKDSIPYTDMEEAARALQKLGNELEDGDSWYIGLWHNGKVLFIEPSYFILKKSQALELGAFHNQESIYDWENEDLIFIRRCCVTGEYITEGYYSEPDGKYFKGLDELLTEYTQDELDKIWASDEDSWEVYWTSWED